MIKPQPIDFKAEIEDRIEMEIVVDAYHEEERAMGWYYYLQENLAFPFKAKCTHTKATSPLSLGEAVDVIDMAKEADCLYDMLVKIKWKDRSLAVPLSQLEAINSENNQPLEDWHYWLAQGYQF
jgi:hypothetical protein